MKKFNFGRRNDWAIRKATDETLNEPWVKFINSLPGHEELNKSLAEANRATTRKSDSSKGEGHGK